jgi:hypothetical protein
MGFPRTILPAVVTAANVVAGASAASPFTKVLDHAGHDCRGTLIFPAEQPTGALLLPVFDGLHGAWSASASGPGFSRIQGAQSDVSLMDFGHPSTLCCGSQPAPERDTDIP